ncbi:nucleotidyltransferase [Corynebacterium striatum]
MTNLELKLAGWTGPSSPTEQEKQDRTERMIWEAIEAHPAFDGMSCKIYAKGSYANNTNVKADSDVDIAVECQDLFYWDEHTPGAHPASNGIYEGIWTPEKLRHELTIALRARFSTSVDTSGSTAIQINSNSARVEADVVPCFSYRYYFSPTSYREGAKIFKTDGNSIVNYSALQLENGRNKNNRTNYRFKKSVRIIKRLENAMAEEGYHQEVPSFFIECLVYNCPDTVFQRLTWIETVKGILAHIYTSLEGAEPTDSENRWLEVNGAKYLFHGSQKWSREDGRNFAYAGWNYLGLGGA